MTEVHVIEWFDAVASTGWQKKAAADPCQACTSVGYLVVEDDARVVLGGTWGMNGDEMETNNRMTIPKGWIARRRVLNLAALRGKSALKDSRRKGKKPVTSARRKRKPFN